jgi:hypothetical protein
MAAAAGTIAIAVRVLVPSRRWAGEPAATGSFLSATGTDGEPTLVQTTARAGGFSRVSVQPEAPAQRI